MFSKGFFQMLAICGTVGIIAGLSIDLASCSKRVAVKPAATVPIYTLKPGTGATAGSEVWEAVPAGAFAGRVLVLYVRNANGSWDRMRSDEIGKCSNGVMCGLWPVDQAFIDGRPK